MSDTVRNNSAKNRFELHLAGATAFATYRRIGEVVAVTYTEVPPPLRGRGIGGRLVRGMLDSLRAEGLRVRPLCSFVRSYIARHPDVQDLLA